MYNSNSPWLDRSLRLSSLFEPLLSSIAEDIATEAGKRPRQDAVENIKTALSVILVNLIRSCALHPSRGVRIDLSNDGYRQGPFNPNQLGIRAVSKVVRFLSQSNPPLVQKRGGNFDKKRGRGYATEIWASEPLKEILINSIREITNVKTNDIYHQPITRNTFQFDHYIELYDLISSEKPVTIIRLRKGSSKCDRSFIDFVKNEETQSMSDRLDSYNSFISSDTSLNLFLTDKEIIALQNRNCLDYDEFGEPKPESSSIDLVSAKRLYRVFNNGTFDHGGRFYGGWWQNVPREYRRFITINGKPTVEVDYSNMQLAMLYARMGYQLEGDAYAIGGIDPQHRDLIKQETLKLINAKGHMEAPRKSSLPSGWTWKELQDAISEKHKPVAEYFGSGEGIRLQRLDSDIAEDVIMRMMDKGVPVLPIHDSFIVAEGYADDLSEIMLDAYQQRMGGMTISLKHSPSLFDELLASQGEVSVSERHSLAMRLFLAKREAPEYEGYRLREELLGRPKSGSSEKGTEIRPIGQAVSMLRDTFSKAGPKAAIANSGRRRPLKPEKHLWDRSMGRG